jgi:hypothetical protein
VKRRDRAAWPDEETAMHRAAAYVMSILLVAGLHIALAQQAAHIVA